MRALHDLGVLLATHPELGLLLVATLVLCLFYERRRQAEARARDADAAAELDERERRSAEKAAQALDRVERERAAHKRELEQLEERRRRDAAESAELAVLLQAFHARKPSPRFLAESSKRFRPRIKLEPLRDRVCIPAGSSFSVPFFTAPVGTCNYYDTSRPKDYGDTNMVCPDRLPEPETFEGVALALVPDEDTDEEDLVRLKSAWVSVMDGTWRIWQRRLASELLVSTPTPRVLAGDGDSFIIGTNYCFRGEISGSVALKKPMHVSLYIFGFRAEPDPDPYPRAPESWLVASAFALGRAELEDASGNVYSAAPPLKPVAQVEHDELP